MSDVGTVELHTTYDEHGAVTAVEVVRADPVIAVTMELLHAAGRVARFRDGFLLLGTGATGAYVYRPVRFTNQGHVVCELLGAMNG